MYNKHMINAIQLQFKKAPVTVSLVAISVAMFLVEFILGHGQTTNGQLLVALGAKWGPAIAVDHQYWRLLTPIFLHAGWLHLITNMLTLWFIGPLAEAVFGHRKFLGLYLFGGVVGNMISYLFAPFTVSVGASTALFGLFGGLLMFASQFRHEPAIRAQGTTLLLFVGLNLITGFGANGVDMWGHIGGLIGGIMFAVMAGFYGRSGWFPLYMRLTLIGVSVLFVLLTGLAGGGMK